MFSSVGLAVLALASVGLADDNAVSVRTLDFKNRFQESGIVPEVIPALDPQVSFYASYMAADGHTELLVPGASLSITEARQPLEFSVENLANATNVTAATRYLIYLLDADAPARNNPTARNLRHYLAGNYSLAGVNSGVLTTAQRLAIPPANFNPFTQFTNPNPAPNTGIHRFIYALYMQPARFNTIGFDTAMEAETANWNLSRWRTQLGLGPAIGATFFTIDTGINGGQGGNSSGPLPTGGAPAGVSPSAYGAGLSAIVAIFGLMMLV